MNPISRQLHRDSATECTSSQDAKCRSLWSKLVAKFRGKRGRWLIAILGCIAFWLHPSGGCATATCVLLALYGLCHFEKMKKAWLSPAGIAFLLLALIPLLSISWSCYPAGTKRDLLKIFPIFFGIASIPSVANTKERIWNGLLLSAGCITIALLLDTGRLLHTLGFTSCLLEQARYTKPYLYTHPNVSSMLAGICVFVFMGRIIQKTSQLWQKRFLLSGIAFNGFYLWMMGSRGPQAVFAITALCIPIFLLPGFRTKIIATIISCCIAYCLFSFMGSINPRFNDAKTMRRFNDREIVWNHTSQLLNQENRWLGYGYGKKAFHKAYYENPKQRAPFVRDGNLIFPHAHGYWRMVRFEGGNIGLSVCIIAWSTLIIQTLICAIRREKKTLPPNAHRQEYIQARCLVGTLLSALGCILLYGFWDFPDHAARFAQFSLASLLLAWSTLRHED